MHHLILTIGMWFEWWTGVTNIWWYNFWSGFGSDLTEWITFGTGGVLLYRHLNCHENSCRRLAFRRLTDPDTGEHLRLCNRHHPRKSVTPEHIADVHRRIHLRLHTRQASPDTPKPIV